MRLAATIFAAAAALLFAPACSPPSADPGETAAERASTPAEWTSYRGDAALTGVATGTLPDRLELAWTFETGGPITSSPVVGGGVVYVGSGDYSVYAVRLDDGRKVWATATDDIVEAPPLVLDGRVYVGSADFFFYALDARTGAVLWKKEMGEKIVGSANVAAGPDGSPRLVVGSHDTQLYCFDPKDGRTLWTYATDNFINGTPAVARDEVVFGGCDSILHVVSARTGKSVDQLELGTECFVAGSVALAGGRAYFGHYGNEFVCVDLAAAEIVWRYPSEQYGFFSSPAIGEDRVVFGGRDRKIHCVARKDGAPIWSFTTRRKVDTSPVICGDKVVCGSSDGRVYLLSLADGRELWRYEVGQPILSSPAIARGHVLIGSNDGSLYAFRTTP